MSKLRLQKILMALVILVITGFQVYWLRENFRREERTLDLRTETLFRETVSSLQDSLVRSRLSIALKDTVVNRAFRSAIPRPGFRARSDNRSRTARVINILGEGLKRSDSNRRRDHSVYITLDAKTDFRTVDSLRNHRMSFDSIDPNNIKEMLVVNAGSRSRGFRRYDSTSLGGTVRIPDVAGYGRFSGEDSNFKRAAPINTIYLSNDSGEKFVIKIDSLFNDSVSLPILNSQYAKVLRSEKIDVPFTILKKDQKINLDEDGPRIDFLNPNGFQLVLGKATSYLLKKISLPILFSLFLVGITIFSFILLYRSLIRQQRLAILKNDLISNITHELKTPIATVGVAIEALKNFNAIQDPQKTREYLDISQNELQRLGLLVDKVLKLSMFENKKIEIKTELFDLEKVVEEVIASLRLQLEKYHARLTFTHEGDTNMKGDRLHLMSVVFNLLDNALKYSKGNAAIAVDLAEQGTNLVLKVTDNGIGIPSQYRDKVFEKFFRVPTGDTHNAKGHGLGLSYVAQVIRQHQGEINIDSHEGLGSTFTIILPKQAT